VMDYRISQLRPELDESLMSFVRRAQLDSDCTDGEAQFLAASALLPDARMAERRSFDWSSLSRFFNAAPEELYAMSERSLFYNLGDDSRRGFFRQRAPWIQEKGYSAHCPCCLKESPHWRRSWLGPGALVCSKHKTILVRHCHECGGDLSEMDWGHASPICPTCGAHLSLSPVIQAPPAIAKFAEAICERFRSLCARRPVHQLGFELAHFAATWRAARLLRSKDTRFLPLLEEVRTLAGLESELEFRECDREDVRYVLAALVGNLVAEIEPTFCEHFWVSANNSQLILGSDRIVYFKLLEIARALGISLSPGPPVVGQLTISFASWEGSKGMPKAA